MSARTAELQVAIEPGRHRIGPYLAELWRYRELFWVLVARDVRVRYKETVLGVSWALLQPILSAVIFTYVFGRWAKFPSEGLPYPVFVMAGILPWTFFVAAVGTAGTSLVNAGHLIGKVYFPRALTPLVAVGVAAVDFLISLLVLGGLILATGGRVGTSMLLIPVLLLQLFVLASGLGLLVSSLTMRFRDLKVVLPVVLQLWMFATPVVYPATMVPPRWRWVLFANPVAGLVDAFRGSISGRSIWMETWLVSAGASCCILLVGLVYFSRVERRFADIV